MIERLDIMNLIVVIYWSLLFTVLNLDILLRYLVNFFLYLNTVDSSL